MPARKSTVSLVKQYSVEQMRDLMKSRRKYEKVKVMEEEMETLLKRVKTLKVRIKEGYANLTQKRKRRKTKAKKRTKPKSKPKAPAKEQAA